MKLERASGILLHPTSLNGPYGIGEIGETAHRWVQFLAEAGQTVWQILPLGPTGYGNSPYQTASVFAGNPLLIDLKQLVFQGLLPESVLSDIPDFPQHQVDFGPVIEWKLPLLMDCWRHFKVVGSSEEKEAFRQFCNQHDALWLDEFAMFMAIKNDNGGGSWSDWPRELKLRQQKALGSAARRLRNEIDSYKFLQYLFFKQWAELKSYANQHGIKILGDIPIYVTYDSADVWANQHLFHLDDEGNPTVVAGVPPDYFSETGQLWGNPIYNWERMKEDGFRWWIDRVRITMETVDMVRFDHFRGFEAYWAVPFGSETAVHGEWLKGPNNHLFDAIFDELGELPIIAEDLGLITPEVEELRDRYEFPGMKILQFAFGGDVNDAFLPHNYTDQCVVYTGSHDNDTSVGWFNSAASHEKQFLLDYVGHVPGEVAWELIRLASSSVASLAIFPLQDVLGLGSEARMNLPGHASGHWAWRVVPGQLTENHSRKLKRMSEIFGRLPEKA